MQSMKPKNYNELMSYVRCSQVKRLVPEIDEALFLRIYEHMLSSPDNKVHVSNGKLVFYKNSTPVEHMAVAEATSYTNITLTATGLNIAWVVKEHTSDGGTSGNNNNNNNNNNA